MGLDAKIFVRFPRSSDFPSELAIERMERRFRACFFLRVEMKTNFGFRVFSVEEVPVESMLAIPEHERILAVNVQGRYYSEGYERGDILLYLAIARWFHINYPLGKVFYMTTDGRECCELDAQRARELEVHWAINGYSYYNNLPLQG